MTDNRITISLPVDKHWVRFAQDSLKRYGSMVGFPPRLEDMCSSSVMEACEELVRKAKEAGISEPIDLHLDYKGETIVVDIAYDGRIPLSPHETKDYEYPGLDTNLDDFDADSLWLHMIKKRMDRVRFTVKGSRHILRMVKYRRDEGKEKQAWVMGIKPKLRKDIILHLGGDDPEYPSSTLQAPGKGVLKLGPSETFIIRNMDGETSFHALYMAHLDARGLVSPDMLARLYERLEAKDMLAAPGEHAKNSLFRKTVHKLINPNFSIPNADKVVATVHKRTRFLFSYFGLAALLAMGLSGIVPLLEHRSQFVQVIIELDNIFFSDPLLILPLYVLSLIHVSLHELAHGVTCKHYGGAVPRLGIMFYLASFFFYCDTTAAWNFPEKQKRILVSLAGPIISFAIFGMGLWAAGMFAGTESKWEYVFVAFSLFNFFGLVMNFNPFIKMDAYYVLLDVTGVANLRERSFRFIEKNVLSWLGVGEEAQIKTTLEERRLFWWYGLIGGFVTVVFLILPLLRINQLLKADSISHEKVLFAVLIVVLLLVHLGNLAHRKIKSVRNREYKI